MSQYQTPIRVSVSEAAKLFGVSSKLIRQAIKSGEVRYILVKGRYKVLFESLVVWSQKTARRSNKLQREGIGQYVDKWRLSATKYSPRPPQKQSEG